MINMEQLKAALGTDHVPRFPTHWMLRADKVSQHQYRATLLYAFLGGKEWVAMLTHDAPESETSDLPSPIKKHITGLEKWDYLSVAFVDEHEKKLGKICDRLDLVLTLKEQMNVVGRLPPKLMTVYEDEMERVLDSAKELGKLKEVKQLLREICK